MKDKFEFIGWEFGGSGSAGFLQSSPFQNRLSRIL